MIDIAAGNYDVRSAGQQGLDGRHCLFGEEMNLINGHKLVGVLQGVRNAIDGKRGYS